MDAKNYKEVKTKNAFTPKRINKILVSNDFREVLISQDTSIIEQRIISMILLSIKEEQSRFIKVKTPIKTDERNNFTFDDYFDGWANQGTVNFEIPLKVLNPKRIMKNLSIKTALINMTNINWLQLKDETIAGYSAVPFILEPSWNCSNIYFKMDRAVLKHLVNMSQYYSLMWDLPYKVSSSNTIKFLLWMLKFQKRGSAIRDYQQLLKELYIQKNKYIARSHFERDFLIIVKADLEAFNDYCFDFIYKDGNYTFFIKSNANFKMNKESLTMLDDIRIKRSVKYLTKTRDLNEMNVRSLVTLFNIKGYETLTNKLKCKIDPIFKGDEYIKAVFIHLEKTT